MGTRISFGLAGKMFSAYKQLWPLFYVAFSSKPPGSYAVRRPIGDAAKYELDRVVNDK